MTTGPSRIFCPGCGKELTPNDRFCPDCGERIVESPAAPASPVAPTVVLPAVDPLQQPPAVGAPTVVYPPPVQPGYTPPPAQPNYAPPPAQPNYAPPPGYTPPPAQPNYMPNGGLNIPAGVPAAPPAAKGGNSRLWWIIGGGCLGLVILMICGLGAAFVFLLPNGGEWNFSTGNVSSTGGREILLEDDFNDANVSNLGELEDEGRRYEYVNGRFEIEVKDGDSLASQVMGGNFDNVGVEVSVNIPSNTGNVAPGLIFGYQDDNNYYLFSIDNEGWYVLEAIEDGQWETLIKWTEGTGITGSNDTLRVEFGGGEMVLYVNDVEQDRFRDNRFGSGDVGMLVYNMSDRPVYVGFDNLRVYAGE